jgi:hypothetical protein
MDRLCPLAEDGKVAANSLTLGEVLRAFLPSVASLLRLGARPLRVLSLLAACGTSALGAHIYQCAACHKRHFAPRSCGDRHCPRCLAAKSRHWLQQQLASLLPVPYYHCVFTLPKELHALVLLNPARLYPLLFDCAAQALLEFGRHRLGGDLGITAVLHTWGQQLNFHPHLHCIVTGGALGANGQSWRAPKQRKFLFPVRATAFFVASFGPSLPFPTARTFYACPTAETSGQCDAWFQPHAHAGISMPNVPLAARNKP